MKIITKGSRVENSLVSGYSSCARMHIHAKRNIQIKTFVRRVSSEKLE